MLGHFPSLKLSHKSPGLWLELQEAYGHYICITQIFLLQKFCITVTHSPRELIKKKVSKDSLERKGDCFRALQSLEHIFFPRRSVGNSVGTTFLSGEGLDATEQWLKTKQQNFNMLVRGDKNLDSKVKMREVKHPLARCPGALKNSRRGRQSRGL